MRLPMLLFLLCTMHRSQGQDTIMSVENLSAQMGRLDTALINAIDLHGLVDTVSVSQIKGKLLQDYFGDILGSTGTKEPQWNIETNNFYASGQATSYFGDGLFSNVRLEHRITIGGIPVGISGDLTLQNNRVNTRLSAIGISFDQTTLLDKYRGQIGEKALQESLNDFTDEQRVLLKEHLTVEATRQVFQSEQYIAGKNIFQRRLDSLSALVHSKRDSALLDSLEDIRKNIERNERRVDSLYNGSLSKWDEIQQSIQELRGKVNERLQLLEEKMQAGSLHRYLDNYAGNQGWKSLLLNVSRFQLGTFRLRGSSFDVSSIPLHGLGLEVRRNGYYAAVSYGREGRQQRSLPDYVQNFRLTGEGRRILQVKGGVGVPEKSHLHVAFTSIHLPGDTNDSIGPSFPRRNVLVSLDSRYLVSERFFVELTGSVSNVDFTGKAHTKELLENLYGEAAQGRNNMAGLMRAGWRDKKGQSEYTIGFQIVGSNFVTLGNLFLVNNRNAIRLEAKQRFLHSRGQLKLMYLKGTTNGTTDVNPGIRQDQFSGELSYRLNKHGSRVWANYSPSFYLQNAPGSASTAYQLNLATVGTQWVFPRRNKGQWMTMMQLTNFADQSQYGDTSIVTGLWYGMLNQTYASEKYLVTALANVGMDKENLKSVRDVNVDISQSFILKHLQLSQGIQLVRRFYGSGFLAGSSGGIQLNVKNRFRIGLSGTYFIGISEGEANQFFLNSSAGWQF